MFYYRRCGWQRSHFHCIKTLSTAYYGTGSKWMVAIENLRNLSPMAMVMKKDGHERVSFVHIYFFADIRQVVHKSAPKCEIILHHTDRGRQTRA